jgi:hypothetical protein
MSSLCVRARVNAGRGCLPALLKTELQEMQNVMASPRGRFLDDDLSHSRSYHTEDALLQFGMFMPQLIAMCHNLAEQMGNNVREAPEDIRSANDTALAQLTLIAGRTEERFEELSGREVLGVQHAWQLRLHPVVSAPACCAVDARSCGRRLARENMGMLQQ